MSAMKTAARTILITALCLMVVAGGGLAYLYFQKSSGAECASDWSCWPACQCVASRCTNLANAVAARSHYLDVVARCRNVDSAEDLRSIESDIESLLDANDDLRHIFDLVYEGGNASGAWIAAGWAPLCITPLHDEVLGALHDMATRDDWRTYIGPGSPFEPTDKSPMVAAAEADPCRARFLGIWSGQNAHGDFVVHYFYPGWTDLKLAGVRFSEIAPSGVAYRWEVDCDNHPISFFLIGERDGDEIRRTMYNVIFHTADSMVMASVRSGTQEPVHYELVRTR